MIEPGYGWMRVSQFQDRTVEDFVAQGRGALQAGPQPQGPGARPAQRPGRPARRRGRDLGGLPAGGRRSWSPPTASSPSRKFDLQGLARVLPAPRRHRPAEAPAGSAQERCRWWCWSTKARPRPARSSPARCRTTSAPSSWARRPSARARCRRCARWPPTPALKITTARYYTPSGALDPGQGHRARRHARRDRRRQRVRRAAHARGRPRQAPAERPGRRSEGRGAREGARGSAQEARGQQAARARADRSRCPSSAAPRTSSWPRR